MQSLRVPAFPEVACYYYEIGNKDRGRVARAGVEVAGRARCEEVFQPDLLQTLANYKREEVCYGDVFVVPRTNVSSGATPKAEQENPAERGAFE
nr:hypothetical protein [Sinorhizobium medicae]